MARYSLYMLHVMVLERERSQKPKFFTSPRNCSVISFTARTSPLAFLRLLRRDMKNQKRDLARVGFSPKSFMRYTLGWGFFSVGRRRPTTWYCLIAPRLLLFPLLVHGMLKLSSLPCTLLIPLLPM